MSPAAGKRTRGLRHFRRRIRNWFVGLLGPLFVRTLVRSLRVRGISHPLADGGEADGLEPGIYVFWHQRLLLLAGLFHGTGFRVIVSEHGDGEMIARIITGLGMHAIRGSSTRGGARASLAILRGEHAGAYYGLTPDGPRGPRHVFHDGAIFLASRTGMPIIPVTVAFARAWRLPTWDGFLLPVPGTRAIARFGAYWRVEAGLDREGLEAARLDAERRLAELTRDTETRFEELYAEAHFHGRPPLVREVPVRA